VRSATTPTETVQAHSGPSRGPLGIRAALRWALGTYLRRAPLEFGKGRMLRLLGPIAAGERELVRSSYAGEMEIELDIGEYIQSNIFYRGYYEPYVVRAIRSLLHRGQDAVDGRRQYRLLHTNHGGCSRLVGPGPRI